MTSSERICERRARDPAARAGFGWRSSPHNARSGRAARDQRSSIEEVWRSRVDEVLVRTVTSRIVFGRERLGAVQPTPESSRETARGRNVLKGGRGQVVAIDDLGPGLRIAARAFGGRWDRSMGSTLELRARSDIESGLL